MTAPFVPTPREEVLKQFKSVPTALPANDNSSLENPEDFPENRDAILIPRGCAVLTEDKPVGFRYLGAGVGTIIQGKNSKKTLVIATDVLAPDEHHKIRDIVDRSFDKSEELTVRLVGGNVHSGQPHRSPEFVKNNLTAIYNAFKKREVETQYISQDIGLFNENGTESGHIIFDPSTSTFTTKTNPTKEISNAYLTHQRLNFSEFPVDRGPIPFADATQEPASFPAILLTRNEVSELRQNVNTPPHIDSGQKPKNVYERFREPYQKARADVLDQIKEFLAENTIDSEHTENWLESKLNRAPLHVGEGAAKANEPLVKAFKAAFTEYTGVDGTLVMGVFPKELDALAKFEFPTKERETQIGVSRAAGGGRW